MLRKKIQVTTEEPIGAEGGPEVDADQQEPEFGNHVIPPETAEAQPQDEAGTEAAGAASDAVAGLITTLQTQLNEARARADDAEKRVLYLQADYQNYRRRRDEEQIGLSRFANAEMIKSLLPVLDNFERALRAAEQTHNLDALVAGVSGTLKQLTTFLEKAGVTPIEAVGKEFDPKFHEAIGHAESDEFPPHTVAEELQKGYVMHDRVLRPSLVKVVQG
jgi:molecular chaperone GrpE